MRLQPTMFTRLFGRVTLVSVSPLAKIIEKDEKKYLGCLSKIFERRKTFDLIDFFLLRICWLIERVGEDN
jgi:hypothetical protein